jgi:hypothetical protein
MRENLKRVSLCVFIPLMLMTGCVSGRQFGLLSIGELHNDGVRYVLERLNGIPRKQELRSSITRLTMEYCAAIGRSCAVSAPTPSFPLDANRLINSTAGSSELKFRVRSVFQAVARSRNVPDLEASLTRIEGEATGKLSLNESRRFSDVVSVARSSAQLWAPLALGGRNGGYIRYPGWGNTGPGGGVVSMIVDWGEVAEADALGCWVAPEGGCLEWAISFSTDNINYQRNN